MACWWCGQSGGGGRRLSSAAGRGDGGNSSAPAASIFPYQQCLPQHSHDAYAHNWARANTSLERGFLCSGGAVSLQLWNYNATIDTSHSRKRVSKSDYYLYHFIFTHVFWPRKNYYHYSLLETWIFWWVCSLTFSNSLRVSPVGGVPATGPGQQPEQWVRIRGGVLSPHTKPHTIKGV